MIYRRFRRRHKQAVHTCTVLVSLSSVPLVSRDLQRIAARIAERRVLRACLYRGYSIHLRLSCRSHGGTLTRPFCRAACRANAQREQGKREKYVTGISDYLLHSLRRTAFVRLFTIQVSRIPLSRCLRCQPSRASVAHRGRVVDRNGGNAVERLGSAMRGNTRERELYAVESPSVAVGCLSQLCKRSLPQFVRLVKRNLQFCENSFSACQTSTQPPAAPVRSARARPPVPPWHDPPRNGMPSFDQTRHRGDVYTLTAAPPASTGAVITFQSVGFVSTTRKKTSKTA